MALLSLRIRFLIYFFQCVMKLFVKIARLENLFSKRKLPHFRGNEAMLEPSKSCIMEKDLKDHLSPLLLLHLSSYLITFFLRLVCTSSEIRNARGQGTLQDYLFINNIPCERNELELDSPYISGVCALKKNFKRTLLHNNNKKD